MLYGAQTQRALENFRLSGLRFPRVFLRALGMIKEAAAAVNAGFGLLDEERAALIMQAAREVSAGRWDEHFPLDVFQTGSGTSTNMNANEVIANRAAQMCGSSSGRGPIHPNDHVNMSQSSNDVIPSALHLSVCLEINELLLPALRRLHEGLKKREREHGDVVKTGRTHLMDAVPVGFGQEISGWSYQVAQGIERVESCLPRLQLLAIGGTAVGTGVNAPAGFGRQMAERLSVLSGLTFREAENHFAAQASMDSAVELSGHLKATATAVMKIANDLRWMNSGPHAGLGEISLPALQPGSSIMPGKVNPVICEAVNMACAQVIGNDTAITVGNLYGNFELNVMLPLIAYDLLGSISLLGNAAAALADKAIAGFVVNLAHIDAVASRNLMLAAALAPVTGHDRAAEIVRKAMAEGRDIRDVAAEMTGMPAGEIDVLLDPRRMTGEK
ncbi:MAG: class II fumarate hydratase [Nitrospirae bacterium]|nr:class II fumarate hydratase [Nitrospirota bacterium]